VDDPARLDIIVRSLDLVSRRLGMTVFFSVHPRTRRRLQGLVIPRGLCLSRPLGFFDFVALEKQACIVLTDSGTVQEECSLLKVPTVTVRDSTERPETVECGSNVVSGVESPARVLRCALRMLGRKADWISPYEKDVAVSSRVAGFMASLARARRRCAS